MATIERRIRQADLTNLSEPPMSAFDWEDFHRGIVLFNDGQYWQSHEAWEEIWKRHQENSRIFFQGLIQVAAGMHQLNRHIFHGADKHFRNALWKLRPFQPLFLGVDVRNVVQKVEHSLREIHRLGEEKLAKFNKALIPKIERKSD